MSTWAIAMVKNEIDVIGYNIDWLITQVDNILIADNLSTDGTYELLMEKTHIYPQIHLIKDEEAAYYQSSKMNALFHTAKEIDDSLEWVMPFDADEFFFARGASIKEALAIANCDVVMAPVWHMVSKMDNEVTNPLEQIQWRQENPEKFPVIAFRWNDKASIHIGNHGVDWPAGRVEHGLLEVKHYQYRSLPQFIRKVKTGKAALEMTGFDQGIGAHWRVYGAMDESALASVWREWANEPGLVFDPW